MDYVQQRVAQLAANPSIANTSLLTPLNILLLSLFLYTTYTFLRPAAPTPIPPAAPAIVFRTFTPHTLLPYNGVTKPEVYLAVRGRVFDVTGGRNFYGPGGPYANFAGRDASRGLACGSFDEEMLTKDLDGPLDRLEGLGSDELEALRGWEERFEEKYLVVGKLSHRRSHHKPALMIFATFSATPYAVAMGLARAGNGMMLASATLTFLVPYMHSYESTPPPISHGIMERTPV
ncbi:cytochrome b5 [Trichocladium antarcticum]|uniref:Cytochrome b5 n=1 Tax=Trichocladium antarcticum TaxID=1450529 RepID=A0AAN6ZDP8_9PEZI|nr:cytochrome b5 [Trichocladium antarcticum]